MYVEALVNPASLDSYRTVHPTVGIHKQKRLRTANTPFIIVEMI